MFSINRTTVATIIKDPAFAGLCERYSNECRIREIPNGRVMLERYQSLDEQGDLAVLEARLDGVLVGFAAVQFTMFKHHGYPMAMLDAVFLDKPARQGTRGARLVKQAKQVASDNGAPGLWLSAPVGSNMAGLAKALGFRETNIVYFAPCSKGE